MEIFIIFVMWLIVIAIFVNKLYGNIKKESFYIDYYYPDYNKYYKSRHRIYNNNFLLPEFLWWNSNRSTRNMSYDLRGDIPVHDVRPNMIWNVSSLNPIHNKPLV